MWGSFINYVTHKKGGEGVNPRKIQARCGLRRDKIECDVRLKPAALEASKKKQRDASKSGKKPSLKKVACGRF